MRRVPLVIAVLAVLAGTLSTASASLSESPSAFVRAHADSPVRFHAWGDDAAFARARSENKPVYVIVGAFTQELARAMREQSFTREENATMLNEGFVCVVMDRDQHPDVAAYLQSYVTGVKQMQGWPLNVWLTPELKPFEGATYLPPSDEWGKEGFPNAVRRVLTAWQTDPEAQSAKADEAVVALEAVLPTSRPEPVTADAAQALVEETATSSLAMFDSTNGGFGDAPRRLEPELLRFLLQREPQSGRDAALMTLRAVAASPVRDPLDGGFFRSAGDPTWQQPTLQKLLADQGRAALAYTEAAMPEAADGALRFALSLRGPKNGPFAAAVDATAESILSSFFWTVPEAQAAVGADASPEALSTLGISEAGNVPPDSYPGLDSTGKSLPRCATLPTDPATVAMLNKLRTARDQRATIARDPLASSGSPGVLLTALSRSNDTTLRAAAKELAAFVRRELILADGRLRAAPGLATMAGPKDYALITDGLLAYASTAGDNSVREHAAALLAKADALFWDASLGRYFAASLPLAPGISLRLPAPAPDAGDIGATESMMLLVLCTHDLGDAEKRAALAAAIAADIRESGLPARGDQALALQAWLKTSP